MTIAQRVYQPGFDSANSVLAASRDGRLPPLPEDQAWFWSEVSYQPVGCWEWGRGRYSKGYGYVQRGPKRWMTHRLSYFLTHGALPDDMEVLHSCDNPPCARPDDLFLGTQLENIHDALRKGRMHDTKHRSLRARSRKLAPEQVLEIRKRKATETYASLARVFSVDPSTIWKICNSGKWTWLNEQ